MISRKIVESMLSKTVGRTYWPSASWPRGNRLDNC